MKRLRRGSKTLLIDAGGIPRDAIGHRTDRPAEYSTTGQRTWRADELRFALGERVRAVHPDSEYPQYQRMAQGECGTIMVPSEFVRREYWVLPDKWLMNFRQCRSGLYLARMPEYNLEPE